MREGISEDNPRPSNAPAIKRICTYGAALVAIGGVLVPHAGAQDTTSSVGFELTLTNSGFGFGGYVRDSLGADWAIIGEALITSGKDEREEAFFNRFGQKSIPGKANYLIVAPVHVGVQRRVFREQIEDNFRPFYQISAGPAIAWEYPYFQDCNGDGRYEVQADCNGDGQVGPSEGDRRLSVYRGISRGRFLFGLGGSVTVGSYFGRGTRGARGFRVGYAFNYYPAGTSLLEVDFEDPRHFFGTPYVAVFFGKLF